MNTCSCIKRPAHNVWTNYIFARSKCKFILCPLFELTIGGKHKTINSTENNYMFYLKKLYTL